MADFRIGITFVDNRENESNVSEEILLTNITVGSVISFKVPPAPFPYVTKINIYSSLADDKDGALFFVKEINAPAVQTSETISSLDTARNEFLPAPTTNFPPEPGYKYATFWLNRLHLGHKVGTNTSRVSSSKTDNSHAFPRTLIQEIANEDGSDIRGFVRGRLLTVLKGSATWVFPDDVEERAAEVRLEDIGIEDDQTSVGAAGFGYWLSEQGLIFFDGYQAQVIDTFPTPVVPLVAEFRTASNKLSVRTRTTIRWSWTNPISGTDTKVLLYDISDKQFLHDQYPFIVKKWMFNRESQTYGGFTFEEGTLAVVGDAIVQMDSGNTDLGTGITAVAEGLAVAPDSGSYSQANWDGLLVDCSGSAADTLSADITTIDGTTTQNIPLTLTGVNVRQDPPVSCRVSQDFVSRMLKAKISFTNTAKVHGCYTTFKQRGRRV